MTRPGAVLLHGGGRITDDAFDRFVDLAGGKEARIVFVPSAGYRESDYESEAEFLEEISDRYSGWLSLERHGHIASFRFLYTDDPEDADDEEFVSAIESATGVWFSGGYQGRLNYRFVGEFPGTTLFQDALRGVLERGGIIGGTSAGMAALPEIMTLWQDQEDDLSPAAVVAAHGLGIFRGPSSNSTSIPSVVGSNDSPVCSRYRSTRSTLWSSRRRVAHGGASRRRRGGLVDSGRSIGVAWSGFIAVFLRAKEWRALTWYELKSGELAKLLLDEDRHPSLSR